MVLLLTGVSETLDWDSDWICWFSLLRSNVSVVSASLVNILFVIIGAKKRTWR
jgi:hypothetical protein